MIRVRSEAALLLKTEPLDWGPPRPLSGALPASSVAPQRAGKAAIFEKIYPLVMEEGSGSCWVTPTVKIPTAGLVTLRRTGQSEGRCLERDFTLPVAVRLVKRQPQKSPLEEGEGRNLFLSLPLSNRVLLCDPG